MSLSANVSRDLWMLEVELRFDRLGQAVTTRSTCADGRKSSDAETPDAFAPVPPTSSTEFWLATAQPSNSPLCSKLFLRHTAAELKMADNEKKRKSTDSHGTHKKKNKVTASSTASSAPQTIKVTSVTQGKASPPVIGMFIVFCATFFTSVQSLTSQIATAPGISIAKDAVFNSYTRQPTTSKRPRHRSHDLLLHSTSHNSLDYTAREDKPKDGNGLLSHYIGLFDPATGQLQLVEAKKMVVRGAVRAQQAAEDDMQSPQKAPQVRASSREFVRTETAKHCCAVPLRSQDRAGPGFRYQEGQEGFSSCNRQRDFHCETPERRCTKGPRLIREGPHGVHPRCGT